ncbi:uncharacterized protein LOC114713014, partial [Neltuma alba]|uniref:uncharacterized protein LOC114713014 n=1 Tax=Neltuma alba TaxID=207710 RepID=UPI0010A45B8E
AHQYCTKNGSYCKKFIEDLNSSKDTWSLHAKIVRKWPVPRKIPPYAVWKVSMLLVDEQESRIEAFTTQKSLIRRIIEELREGVVYHFENFEVLLNKDEYKVTDCKYKLSFHCSTSIEESDLSIPFDAFNFVTIKDVAEFNANNEDLIDVIGFLQSFGDLKDHKKEGGSTRKLSFTIADENERSVNVVVFGQCANEIFRAKGEDLQPPIVVLLRFARINRGKGFGHLTNQFEGTKVVFNPDLPETKKLLDSLEDNPVASQSLSQVSSCVIATATNESLLSFPCRINVAQIMNFTEPCEVVTKLVIEKLETAYGWNYDGCPCDKKPFYVNGKLKCSACNTEVKMTEPKFKVHYKARDSTGKCSIIFFNRLASQLLNCVAADLKDQMIKMGKPMGFPKELSDCIGKEVLVKLKIKDFNIGHPNSSMGVSQFSDDMHIIEKFTYSEYQENPPTLTEASPVESSASKSSPKIVLVEAEEDDDLTDSQIVTPEDTNAKRRKLSKTISQAVDDGDDHDKAYQNISSVEMQMKECRSQHDGAQNIIQDHFSIRSKAVYETPTKPILPDITNSQTLYKEGGFEVNPTSFANHAQPEDIQYFSTNGERAFCPKRRRIENVSSLAENLTHELYHDTRREDISASEGIQGDDHLYDSFNINLDGYLDEGNPEFECQYCGAMLWFNERIKRAPSNERPIFSICCSHGKVSVPHLQTPPEQLRKLFFDKGDPKSKKFQSSIRAYNNMFCFTSMGGKINHSLNSNGGGPYTFVISGQNHHYIGSLLPEEGANPVYSQLYIYDTEHEIANRLSAIRHASNILKRDRHANVKICLIRHMGPDNRCYNLPTSSEVAALIVGDFDRSYHKRDIVVEKQGTLKRIDEFHRSYLPLQYPLLFHFGNNGYDPNIMHSTQSLYHTRKKKKLTIRRRGETNASMIGRRVVLPSSFIGGARYMVNNFQDAMAICKYAGYPDIFLTFTCNPAWPEVKRYCTDYELNQSDCPQILSRIFKLKLDALMKVIREQKIFGKIRAEIYTIEFQKRGLPHAHIILFLEHDDKPRTPEDVDKLICAEIPDKELDPELYELVGNYMIHGPCGHSNKNSPCMKDGKCSKYFPKKYVDNTAVDEEGYPTYRRRKDGRTIEKKGIPLDNRFVVPYNPHLLRLFRAHINVEKTNQSRAVKYLFKYISKGNDRVVAGIYSNPDTSSSETSFDEISHYLNCRYVSPCEAAWRIFAFDIHHRYPSVERLSFHLPEQQVVYYSGKSSVSSLLDKPRMKESMFLAWMDLNKSGGLAKTMTYIQIPQYYTFDKNQRIWKPRQRGFAVGRLAHASPTQGEIYYLRVLLTKARGPKSYEDIRTVDGIIHPTFKSACYALGLLNDDQEFIDAIKEASIWASRHYLRKFFVSMLLCNCLSQPLLVWQKSKQLIFEDMLYVARPQQQLSGISITDDEKEEVALIEIERLLKRNGKSLSDFPSMPKPKTDTHIDMRNHLLLQELNYDRDSCRSESYKLRASLTDEQLNIFNEILNAIDSSNENFFFVYGFGGTGKTFLWNALTATIRGRGEIVINVASSGIAATLLPSGRTAHSRFAIPIDITEESMCNISHNSPMSNLIRNTKLFIWDEAPMVRRYCIEAVDRTFKDIMKCDHPFGGKCVVMGGDFRQILPVVPKGGRADIVDASINSSELWNHCRMFQLTKNMRLLSSGDHGDNLKVQQFSEWLLQVGEGKIGLPNEGVTDIEIPSEILIQSSDNHIQSIVSVTYPNLKYHINNSEYLTNRAILAPTIEVVDQINDHVCSMLDGEYVEYFSSDSITAADQDVEFQELYTTEFLNTINCSGLPPHRLALKVGCPVMLIRNIDQASGLCNGTRLQTTFLGKHFIKAIALNGTSVGQEVLIHRMDMNPSETKLPFTMVRRQFPLIISFAMTINKSQGQSMTNVGLYLPRPVFSHGQLYVAMSRVRRIDGLKVLIVDSNNKSTNITTNVVYREIFQNVHCH